MSQTKMNIMYFQKSYIYQIRYARMDRCMYVLYYYMILFAHTHTTNISMYGYWDIPGFSTQPTKVGQDAWTKGPCTGQAHLEGCWFGVGGSFTRGVKQWAKMANLFGSFFQSWTVLIDDRQIGGV